MVNKKDISQLGYKVPENYFEGLEHHVHERITTRSSRTKWSVSPAPVIGVLAVLLLIIFFINIPTEVEQTAEEVSPEAIEAYLIAEMSSDELLTEYAETYYTSSNDDYEEYLIEEDVEINTILSEYNY